MKSKLLVKIVEVGLRDGLQNEKSALLPSAIKLRLLDLLYNAGLRYIEGGSFVSPKWVPQMGNSDEIFEYLRKENSRYENATFAALTPNMIGLSKAKELNVQEVAIFGAASESFSKKNINCSIEESLKRFSEVTKDAIQNNMKVRGYVSCVLGCPYEKEVQPAQVIKVAVEMLNMGCYQISLGDTIGIGTPGKTKQLLDEILRVIPANKLAVHFHDTYGQALANILVALQCGIGTIDSSISGLGGCPYAKGASGNVATEDVVYMLDSLKGNNSFGFELELAAAIDLNKLLLASAYIDDQLQRVTQSKVARALGRGSKPSE
eukprot:gene10864-14581_t